MNATGAQGRRTERGATMKRMFRVTVGVAVAGVVSAAPAHAYFEAKYSDSSRVTASGRTIKVYDPKCDAKATQGNWQRLGSSTVYERDNPGGCGTALEFTTANRVTQIRACLVIPASSDPCGAGTLRATERSVETTRSDR